MTFHILLRKSADQVFGFLAHAPAAGLFEAIRAGEIAGQGWTDGERKGLSAPAFEEGLRPHVPKLIIGHKKTCFPEFLYERRRIGNLLSPIKENLLKRRHPQDSACPKIDKGEGIFIRNTDALIISRILKHTVFRLS